MDAKEFVAKWSKIQLKESATAQSHFLDVCKLVKHPSPLDADPDGEFFTFEAPTEKTGMKRGRADVWYGGKFIWEYKGAHANLDKAYRQLLLYRESLGNPPLLITSDTHKIIIHTNFTNSVKDVHNIEFDRLVDGDGLSILSSAFHNPESLRPSKTQTQVTEATAETFVNIVRILMKWAAAEGLEDPSEQLAHFVIRLLFCLFAEDMGLLPEDVFTKLVNYKDLDHVHFREALSELFSAMQQGGNYGFYDIPRFNGDLFDNDFVPELPSDVMRSLMDACRQDWSAIDPSIFGTLFERVIDESKREQLGAHFTSMDDIMLVIEPVAMRPLRLQWISTKSEVIDLVNRDHKDEAFELLSAFADEISGIHVLDPACGSGNFLYVALRQLLDLQKEVIAFAGRHGFPELELTVSPDQLFGIELNRYAHELAQITVWIGYIQWKLENGFMEFEEPILKPLNQISLSDALTAANGDEKSRQPWPDVDVIIGNPPFLGSRKMRPVLGDEYCDDLIEIYKDRIHGIPDLVCYWFDRAEEQIQAGKADRAGLLATQAIRGGTNRQVLKRISKSGGIFMAWSDREWMLDGATVHVSIIGFDGGAESERYLDGVGVSRINSDLTSGTDITEAAKLAENSKISFQGVVLRGKFNVTETHAKQMIEASKNPNGRSNADVLRPRRTGQDVVGRAKNEYVVDFGLDMSADDAAQYVLPFEYLREHVYPARQKANQADARENWWLHWNPRRNMRNALAGLSRYIATSRVGKHRIFGWLEPDILPDTALVVFAREDDYFFGVLHSRVHEIWSRRMGTQLRDAASGFRYTSQTTFETFPFPWVPGQEVDSDSNYLKISGRANELNGFRESWLHVREGDIGITVSSKTARKFTLTNLYNALNFYRSTIKAKHRDQSAWDLEVGSTISISQIEQLDHLHEKLDQAVMEAYGWSGKIDNEEILRRLLELNNSGRGPE